MEIVPTSVPKKRRTDFDDLVAYKAELIMQISTQKEQILVSGKKMFSWESVAGYVMGTIQRSLTLADGVVIGMKIVNSIRSFFKK